ncbi:MAG: hypothetical protein DRG82_04360, partial [Deltaproteobacteria bacterium]
MFQYERARFPWFIRILDTFEIKYFQKPKQDKLLFLCGRREGYLFMTYLWGKPQPARRVECRLELWQVLFSVSGRFLRLYLVVTLQLKQANISPMDHSQKAFLIIFLHNRKKRKLLDLRLMQGMFQWI